MAEKYTRSKYGLNDFYMEYVHYKGFNLRMAEAYAGLYKMYDGKKEVMEVSPATFWFLGVQERMHLVQETLRTKQLAFEKEKNRLDDIDEYNKLRKKYIKEYVDYFYNQMCMPALFLLKHYFNLEYKTIKEPEHTVVEIYKTDGSLLYKGTFILCYDYIVGEANKTFNRIYASLSQNGVSVNDAEMISNSVTHNIFNTDKRIKNWFYPNPRAKYNI